MLKTSLWNLCAPLGADLGKGELNNANSCVQVVQLDQPVFLVADLEQQHLASQPTKSVWLQQEAAIAAEVGTQQTAEGLSQERVDAIDVGALRQAEGATVTLDSGNAHSGSQLQTERAPWGANEHKVTSPLHTTVNCIFYWEQHEVLARFTEVAEVESFCIRCADSGKESSSWQWFVLNVWSDHKAIRTTDINLGGEFISPEEELWQIIAVGVDLETNHIFLLSWNSAGGECQIV